MNALVAFIERVKQKEFLQIFTVYLRYLIGAAFIMAAFGMGKFQNVQMQESDVDTSSLPAKTAQFLQFWRVMYSSGLFWKFIGLTQVIGGALLMIQRFAKAGAIIFFVMILNIFIITIAFGFEGTWIITGLMLLATIFLLVWDLSSLQFIFRKPTAENFPQLIKLKTAEHPYWVIIGAFMMMVIFLMIILNVNLVVQLASTFLLGLFAFFGYAFFLRRRILYS
jgi:hypothetical protein